MAAMMKSTKQGASAGYSDAPTPVRNLVKHPVCNDDEDDQVSCKVCIGCIRPPFHEGNCMNGQCDEIFPEESAEPVLAPTIASTVLPVQENFSVGDRVKNKRHGKEGVVIALDSAGDPKVLYDGEAKAEGKKGKFFEITFKDKDGSFMKKLQEEIDRSKAEDEEARRLKAAEELARQEAAEELSRQKAEEEAELALQKAAEEEALRLAAEKEAEAAADEERRTKRLAVAAKELDDMDVLCVETYLRCTEEYVRTPLKGTLLYTKVMRPCRPPGTSVDVKDSNFRSLGKFLEFLEEEGLLRLKPGYTDPVVESINRNACAKYKFVPKPKGEVGSTTPAASTPTKSSISLSSPNFTMGSPLASPSKSSLSLSAPSFTMPGSLGPAPGSFLGFNSFQ